MSFKFTIGKKIGTGFGVLILFIIIVFGATFFAVDNGISTFKKNDQTTNELIQVLTPSKEKVSNLRLSINESKLLAIQWVNDQSRNDVPDKIRLKNLIDHNIPKVIEDIQTLTPEWQNENDRLIFDRVIGKIDTLFGFYHEIMMLLPNIASYDDELSYFMCRLYVSQDGDVPVMAGTIEQNLLTLQNSLEQQEEDALALVKSSSAESKEKFQALTFYWALGAALIMSAILIAIFTTNSIVKPLYSLRNVLISLSKGIFPKTKMAVRKDEIGDMTIAMNGLVDGLQKTTDFAREVGQSNFNFPYQPLSEEDVLGHALLKMRDELAETERILARKVEERTAEVVSQRDEIERQRLKLVDLYKDVTDSIRYAKRLQYSILPPQEVIRKVCPDSFVLFKPKDIVSGDFYWFFQTEGKSLVAAVDCTGHGVPGAFMSLVGANGLNAAVKEHKKTSPGLILNELNNFVSDSLNKGSEDSNVRDGMDISFCTIDYKNMELEFAGANNPLYIIRNNEYIIVKADKLAIGSFEPGAQQYSNTRVPIQKGDMIYLFTDGYADQFGGEKGKKFLYRHFRDTLMNVHQKNMKEQHDALKHQIESWQGPYEQLDDILVIGVRI
ncbi:MAG: SpoIIE family protein phosphatase [Crocinitomicaceae bacterium]|nr:SpoIIE family protein phosphatase [Crocinitomicaceae bacterium]